MTPQHPAQGKHCILDATGVDFELLNDEALLTAMLQSAAVRAGATVLKIDSQRFNPQGVTAFAILSESHISIHTYPELGSFMADIFTCGDQCDPTAAANYLVKELQPGNHKIQVIERGI